MAKVYDALKQLEKERSRQSVSAQPIPRARESLQQPFWKRWSANLARHDNGRDAASPPDSPLADAGASILPRLEELQKNSAAKVFEFEERLRRLESQLQSTEQQLKLQIANVADLHAERVARLGTSVSILFTVVCGTVLILLWRS